MNRIERLTAIIIKLQSKRFVRASEIAGRFEISLRTVYRDIKALEEAGVPIGMETGRGYFISEGYNLPPVMFTESEAQAVLLAHKLVDKFTDKSIRNQFTSSIEKIKSVLKAKTKEEMERLGPYIEVLKGPAFTNNSNLMLTEIQKALIGKKSLLINYLSAYKDEHTLREIGPIGLCFYASNWHLIAFCNLRKDYRDFRLDRIKKLSVLDKNYDLVDKLSLQEYIKRMLEPEGVIPVKVRFNKRIVRFLAEEKYYYGFIKEGETYGEMVEMDFLIQSLGYFARWIITYGKSVEVIGPNELKEHLKILACEIKDHYL